MSVASGAGGAATVLRPEELGAVHLIGIGGAGMSVIAVLLRARGNPVSGSDARESATVVALRELGVRVWVGHDAAHLREARLGSGDTVVVSSAVRESNPELVAARALGTRVIHRSLALAALMQGRAAVAVAGAHGKTTTSAMIAVTLARAGLDPSFAIGGTVLGLDAGGPDGAATQTGALGGARAGAGGVFVAEADESDGSFLAYRPTIAVVTNVEPDHLDHYGSREAFEQAFVDFTGGIEPGGALVACVDDAGAARLVETVRARPAARAVRVLTYGTAPSADVVVGPARGVPGARGTAATLRTSHPTLRGTHREPLELELLLQVPGAHNLLDAAAAWTTACLLGVDPVEAAAGLRTFSGTGRRFEDRGSADGVRVVDDYAHHPTEVAALLTGARPVAGEGRLLVLFQPHLFSRTTSFAAEFARALALADEVVVTDIYAAREDPVPGVTAAVITDLMDASPDAGSRLVVRHVPDRVDAALSIAAAAAPGDLVLTVGAGDVTELAEVVLDALRRRERADDEP